MPVNPTNNDSTTMMIAVRIRVARSESTPWTPIFAKMAVSAANAAERTAQKAQLCVEVMESASLETSQQHSAV
ncbi:hypothetical protein [Propionivibrio sp.]|uniref:hypothetical protein n=1 Tax=Propionivibrio sp. TaxID=2212460 RepID=UPI0039E32A74